MMLQKYARADLFRISISLFVLLYLLPVTVCSQYYFGRNKVMYNQFEWHILQTEHFEIYYYPQMRDLAEIGAQYAEESYAVLELKFNHNINHRIPLIFYATHAHFQETNTISNLIPEGVGGFFEFLKGRVVVPANGSIAQFKHVIRHELVHVFTHSKVNNILRNHKLQNHPEPPLWFQEGLAEYWSAGWDTQAEMFIRDAVLNDYLFPLSYIYQISGSFLMYKEGQAALKYIDDTWGEDKILQIIENCWTSKMFSEVMRLTLGVDYRGFDEKWTYHLKKLKFPLLESFDSARMTSRKLTEHGINIKPTYYQVGDSQKVIFISNRTGYSNIYQAPLRKLEFVHETKPDILVAGERSPAFESFHLLSSSIDVNRSDELTFVSKSGEQDLLYVYHLGQKKIVEQHAFEGLVSLFSPAWAGDNRRVVFSGLAFNGRCDLYLYDRDNGQLQKLTNDAFDDRDPVFTPDGRAVVFSSDRGGVGQKGYYNLFRLHLDSGRITYLTQGEFNDQSPRWSPDGQFLAFVSDRSGTTNIWMAPIHNFGASLADTCKQITNIVTGAVDPAWTKQNDLLFTAFENFSYHLHLLENPSALYEKSRRIAKDTLLAKNDLWSFKRIAGQNTLKEFRYKPKYSMDIAQSQITQDPIFGTSGGAQLVVSDMLGNYQYYFLLYNTARTRSEMMSSFNVAVSRTNLSRRINTAVGVYHFAGRFYNMYDYWFWERRVGGFGAISYPLSKFSRTEASLNVRYSDKEWYNTGYRRQAVLVSNFVSFIHDNSLWGVAGPVDGQRFNVTLGNTLDVAHSNVNFISLLFDYRRYFRLSTQVTHALRVWTQINNGKEATPFFMGGSWDLRGYRFWRLWGTKVALVSNELRFPFIDRFMLHFPFGGITFSAVRGALFVDMGNAWDNQLAKVLGSTGFGVRLNLGGMLLLRFDLGRKFYVDDWRHFNHAHEWQMEKKWFTQFFFGWDF